MMKWLRRLRAVPDLLIAYAILRADVQEAMASTQVREAVNRFRNDPAVALLFPRISAEWRAVEEAVNLLK